MIIVAVRSYSITGCRNNYNARDYHDCYTPFYCSRSSEMISSRQSKGIMNS